MELPYSDTVAWHHLVISLNVNALFLYYGIFMVVSISVPRGCAAFVIQ